MYFPFHPTLLATSPTFFPVANTVTTFVSLHLHCILNRVFSLPSRSAGNIASHLFPTGHSLSGLCPTLSLHLCHSTSLTLHFSRGFLDYICSPAQQATMSLHLCHWDTSAHHCTNVSLTLSPHFSGTLLYFICSFTQLSLHLCHWGRSATSSNTVTMYNVHKYHCAIHTYSSLLWTPSLNTFATFLSLLVDNTELTLFMFHSHCKIKRCQDTRSLTESWPSLLIKSLKTTE